MMAKLRCAAGLAAMDSKKYKQAALRFTEASTSACDMADYAPQQRVQLASNRIDAHGWLAILLRLIMSKCGDARSICGAALH